MRIGFIGAGNMGGALCRAAAKSSMPGDNIYVSDSEVGKAALLARGVNGQCSTNEEIAEKCDYIFLGVKPQIMSQVLSDVAPMLKSRESRFVLVTMAAGLPMKKIAEMAEGDYPIIRIMPNTPASIGKGMILYCAGDKVSQEEKEELCRILSAAGALELLPEKLIDAGSVVSGCGPAFVYMFIDAMAKGGQDCGLDRETAIKCAAMTAYGAAAMLLETKQDPVKLRTDVCSPGGSTIEGVKMLQEMDLDGVVKAAERASYKRTLELGK